MRVTDRGALNALGIELRNETIGGHWPGGRGTPEGHRLRRNPPRAIATLEDTYRVFFQSVHGRVLLTATDHCEDGFAGSE
jgi:hypothetical protein